MFNNIFVKNIPDEWTEADVKKDFGVFGNISSIFMQKKDLGLIAFICYGDVSNGDREYGSKCARLAV